MQTQLIKRLKLDEDSAWAEGLMWKNAFRKNPKRGFLFVSPFLGKHLPTWGEDIYMWGRILAYKLQNRALGFGLYRGEVLSENRLNQYIMNHLCNDIQYPLCGSSTGIWGGSLPMAAADKLPQIDLGPDVCVVGFGETATGLGYAVSEAIVDAKFTYSTRQAVKGGCLRLGFEESHSHVTSCKLPLQNLVKCRTLILVDDEITTGNTIIHLMDEYKRVNPELNQVYAVSLLNWMNADARAEFEARGIKIVSAVSGSIKTKTAKVPKAHACEPSVSNGIGFPSHKPEDVQVSRLHIPARYADNHYLPVPPDEAADSLVPYLTKCVPASPLGCQPVLMMGGGENIPDLMVMSRLLSAYIRTTTRSPICLDASGPIRNAISYYNPITSCEMYLYNYDEFDRFGTLILVESKEFKVAWLGEQFEKLKPHYPQGIYIVECDDV